MRCGDERTCETDITYGKGGDQSLYEENEIIGDFTVEERLMKEVRTCLN